MVRARDVVAECRGGAAADEYAAGGSDLAGQAFGLRAVANQAKLTLHVRVEAAGNDHHVVEAAFKAFARALREAVAVDPTITDIPSTKGLL